MNKKKELLVQIMWELAGSIFYAIGIYNFALQAEFPMTGFSGISIILYRLFNISIGLSTVLLNIPVAILCCKLLGRKFFVSSIRCMLLSSFIVDYVAPLFPVYQGDRLLAALCTGVFCGIGYAMIYTRNSSTGGADFIIMAVKALRPHLSMGNISFLTDVGIILVGGLLFRDIDGMIYGMIVNILSAVVIDKMIYGMNSGKVAFIVTKNGKEICDVIDECSQRGSTILKAQGGYKQDDIQVVMCACNSKEMYNAQKYFGHLLFDGGHPAGAGHGGAGLFRVAAVQPLFCPGAVRHAGQRGGCDPARGGLYRAAGGSAQGGRAGCPEHQAGDHRRERRGLPVFHR